MASIRERVFEALDNAYENGYDLRAWPASETMMDLLTYCGDLDGLEADEVLPHVIAWQKTFRAGTQTQN
jgi:hypothetical protein